MRAPNPTVQRTPGQNLVWGLLTFDRLMTGPIIHLIYWAGLALIVLGGFTVVGAAVGVALRGASLEGILLSISGLVAGLLVLAAAVLLWRGACEFYLAVFRIAEDLHAVRRYMDADARSRGAPPRAE